MIKCKNFWALLGSKIKVVKTVVRPFVMCAMKTKTLLDEFFSSRKLSKTLLPIISLTQGMRFEDSYPKR